MKASCGGEELGRVRSQLPKDSTLQPVGGEYNATFFLLALLLRGNYPTSSLPLPANAWLKPSKTSLALKFQNLQGYRAGNGRACQEGKKTFC